MGIKPVSTLLIRQTRAFFTKCKDVLKKEKKTGILDEEYL